MSVMASCESREEETVTDRKCLTTCTTKYTTRQLESSAEKFVKILDIDLDRLSKHAVNIFRFKMTEDWSGLHKEHVNACRTIQQIGLNIQEIEKVRNQVRDEDLRQFDAKVQVVKSRTISSLERILDSTGLPSGLALQDPATVPSRSTEPTQITQNMNPRLQHQSYSESTESQSVFAHDRQGASPLTPFDCRQSSAAVAPAHFLLSDHRHVIPPDSQASISLEQLQENLIELIDQVHNFATKLEYQDDVTGSLQEITENPKQEKQVTKTTIAYKSALLPVVGAVVGGVVGGPIGLVAGMKIGGLMGAVGGAVGFASGRLVKAHQEKTAMTEMTAMGDQRPASNSDLTECAQPEAKQLSSETTGRGNQAAALSEKTDQKAAADETDVFSAVSTSFRRFFSFSDD